MTRNRKEWLPKAIECFQRQTYPHRELIILADGEDVRHIIPEDNRIRYIHLAPPARQIGDKRNFGCDLAAGSVIAHWDDDDFSAPERLADQVERMVSSGKAVTGYHSMRFTDGKRWWAYNGKNDYAIGTSLCYRREWWERNKFPAVQIGEDNRFVEAAYAARQLISIPAGDMMHATIHRGNTSKRSLKPPTWTEISA